MIDVTREMLIGKLVSFESNEFGESPPKSKSAFKSTVSTKQKYDSGESSIRMSTYEKEMRDLEEEREHEELEAIIARIFPKGVDKYEGNLPLKCFSCNKIEHFSSRCLKRERISKKPLKPYMPKYQKKCYFAADEGVIDDEYEKGN